MRHISEIQLNLCKNNFLGDLQSFRDFNSYAISMLDPVELPHLLGLKKTYFFILRIIEFFFILMEYL